MRPAQREKVMGGNGMPATVQTPPGHTVYPGKTWGEVTPNVGKYNPVKAVVNMVVDVHRVLRKMLRGFAAQAKIHTRNNVGASGKIYFGSKQGYPEKGEKRTDYPGGYVFAYDPKTSQTENFGMPKKYHGVISVTPDEARGKIYVSTCDDGRPIDSWRSPRILSAIALWLVFAIVVYLRYAIHARGRQVAVLTILAFALLLLSLVAPVHPFVAGG